MATESEEESLFRRRVNDWLAESGRTRTWLGREIGADKDRVNRMLNSPPGETRSPQLHELKRIAGVMGVSPGWLIGSIARDPFGQAAFELNSTAHNVAGVLSGALARLQQARDGIDVFDYPRPSDPDGWPEKDLLDGLLESTLGALAHAQELAETIALGTSPGIPRPEGATTRPRPRRLPPFLIRAAEQLGRRRGLQAREAVVDRWLADEPE